MKPRAPRSYDEIVRHTVPTPDGYYHPDPPSTEELLLDKQMGQAISAALLDHGFDALSFEVGRGRVILRGWVRDHETASRIKRIISEAAPEAVIDSRLRIGPAG